MDEEHVGTIIFMSNSMETFEFSLNLLKIDRIQKVIRISKFRKGENSKVSSEFDIKIIVPTCSSSIFTPI